MMSVARTRLVAFIAPFVISLPLSIEVIRKYAYPSNVVLLAGDILAVLVALGLLRQLPHKRITAILGALIAVNISWGLLTIAISHQDLTLGMIGLRNFLVPCAFLAIGASLGKAFGVDRFRHLLYRVFSWWLLIVVVVAVAQLMLGRDYWLNVLPEGFGDEQQGIGDYTAGGIWLEYMFRPTSIFLHTGKLGAILFVLTSYRLCFAVASSSRPGSFWFGRAFDVAALFVGGQRAAILGYALVAMVLLVMRLRRHLFIGALAVGLGVTGFVAFGSAMFSADIGNAEILTLFVLRVFSGITAVPERIANNLLAPLGYILEHYSLLPAGLGAFSLGSISFGGQPLYGVVPIGSAENSFLRLLAEEGVVGLMLGGLFWIALVLYSASVWSVLRSLSATATRSKTDVTLFAICPGLVLAVLLGWANTHDVLGNVTLMSLSMILFGCIRSGKVKLKSTLQSR